MGPSKIICPLISNLSFGIAILCLKSAGRILLTDSFSCSFEEQLPHAAHNTRLPAHKLTLYSPLGSVIKLSRKAPRVPEVIHDVGISQPSMVKAKESYFGPEMGPLGTLSGAMSSTT